MLLARHVHTARLRLRPFSAADVPAIVSALSGFETARWLGRVPHPYRLSDAQEFVARSQDKQVWAIEDGAGFAGMIGMVGELGYWLAPHARGKGYIQEAALHLVACHFADPQVDHLKAGYFIGNHASARILYGLGFVEDGPADRRPSVAWADLRPHQPLRLDRAGWARRFVPQIRTPRLRIDPLRPEDDVVFHRLVTCPSIGRMLQRFPADWTLPQARAFLAEARWQGARPCRLALRHQGRFVGSIGVGQGACPAIFYFLDPAEVGRGLMSEALEGFIGWLSEAWGLRQLTARVFCDNPASRHVLEKAGFRVTGTGSGTSAQRAAPAPDWGLDYEAPDPAA
ncbi:GNAT family N-acetyltransferase [Thioclava litoralis]|uniref:GNAT family N-acetyltransferase n=1 Tax=Thioclava litoralis TaxID=3076557 RepID=A0ABZ1DZS9_9RHOB|nr:GNAT family N-acetyltransferase [Thioclava sp. FTW29]